MARMLKIKCSRCGSGKAVGARATTPATASGNCNAKARSHSTTEGMTHDDWTLYRQGVQPDTENRSLPPSRRGGGATSARAMTGAIDPDYAITPSRSPKVVSSSVSVVTATWI